MQYSVIDWKPFKHPDIFQALVGNYFVTVPGAERPFLSGSSGVLAPLKTLGRQLPFLENHL